MATLQNIFAGCNIRGLFTKADNFQASGSLCLSSSANNSAFCTIMCAHSCTDFLVVLSLMPRWFALQVNYFTSHHNLPPEHKALMMCSMFLIDMVYFETRGDKGQQ